MQSDIFKMKLVFLSTYNLSGESFAFIEIHYSKEIQTLLAFLDLLS